MNTLPSSQEMSQALRERDSSYDGIFYTAVKTTSIFCLPSCSARKPLPQNVEFFFTAREALFSGYRPCLRCHPLHLQGNRPPWIQTVLTEVEKHPEKRFRDENVRDLGIDPVRLRRYFQKHFGMTFQAFSRSRRLQKAFLQIKKGTSIEEAAFENGYESTSGFRDAFMSQFGATPRKTSTDAMVVLAWIESPLGPLLAGAHDKGICFLEFTDRRMLEAQIEALRKRVSPSIAPGSHALIDQAKIELQQYFLGKRQTFDVPLFYPGSPFQIDVWNALRKIPYGKTCSYEDIARDVGNAKASRPVGTANGLNRIAILIPCHRVVNKNGELGGYGGGLWRKRHLLDLEKNSV